MQGIIGESLVAVVYNNMSQYIIGKVLKEEKTLTVSFTKQMEGNMLLVDVEQEQVFPRNVRVTPNDNNP